MARHSTPGYWGSQVVLPGDAIGHRLDVRVDSVLVEVEGNENRIEPGGEVPWQLDAEETIADVRSGASPHYGASRAQHHIAAQRYFPIFPSVCRSPKRLKNDVVSTLETLDAFDVGVDVQSMLTRSDLGNISTTRQSVVIVGPYSQGISRVAEDLEHHGLVRPVRETVRPVRDQEMPMRLGEGTQREPALSRLVGGDETLQSLRDIPLPRPLLHQPCHLPLELGVSDEVEPRDPVLLSHFSRECCPPTLDYR